MTNNERFFQEFFYPPAYPTPPAEIPFLAQANQYQIPYKDADIQVYEWGNPSDQTVVLMHGWAGRATQLGFFVPPLLELGYQVIGFDGTAHGKSTSPLKPTMRVIEFAEIILQLNEKYHFKGAIAHSMGCGAVIIANAWGSKFQKTVLIGCPRHFEYRFQLITQNYGIPEDLKNQLYQQFKENLGADIWQKASSEFYAPQAQGEAYFVYSDDDQEIPYQESEYMASLWGGKAFTQPKTGLGHTRILKDMGVINEVVSFIND
jgi:alpha/beta hydrolase fold